VTRGLWLTAAHSLLDLVAIPLLQAMLEVLVDGPRDGRAWYLEYSPGHESLEEASIALGAVDDLDGVAESRGPGQGRHGLAMLDEGGTPEQEVAVTGWLGGRLDLALLVGVAALLCVDQGLADVQWGCDGGGEGPGYCARHTVREWVVLALAVQIALHFVVHDQVGHLEGDVHVQLGEVGAVESSDAFFAPCLDDAVEGVLVRRVVHLQALLDHCSHMRQKGLVVRILTEGQSDAIGLSDSLHFVLG
jgi:hypothetical protein